ncbi:MAG: hypothetical protein HYY49_02635 [Ignavibacteriales bacterium]|nr:hypothetical protein [Ignavibacteriales bacterium]
MDSNRPARIQTQLIVGFALVAAGALLILDNFEVLDVGPVWKFWPLIIVAVGLNKVFQAETLYQRGKGVWVVFLGCWMFISVFHLFGLGWHNSWPILIIGWGVAMVLKSTFKNERLYGESEVQHGN